MLNFGQLVQTVQNNCHISDARHAGDFTLCIFLLKMREFYRWEYEIPLTHEIPTHAVGAWLQERERLWETLESRTFEPLPLAGGVSDPFDADRINRELVPQGYVYSSGYGQFHKPHFFLGRLLRREQRQGHTIYVAACEYARDLEAPPAMLQDQTIFIRQESVRRFLWEKIEERRWNKNNLALERALTGYGFAADAGAALEGMTANEIEVMILHELGEARAGEMLGEPWHALLASLPRKTEIMARAVRDLLADCLSTLPALLERRQHAALHFYFANFSGMRRHLFPEAMAAYRHWAEHHDDQPLQQAIGAGATRWLTAGRAMLDLHQTRGAQAGVEIEKLLEPNAPASLCVAPAAPGQSA
jgi:hypothetical protein